MPIPRRRFLVSAPGLLAAQGAASPLPVRETAVRDHHGAPALFVNGQPHPGLLFFFCRAADAEQDVRSFAEAGIHAYSGCFGLPGPVRLDGNWDLAGVRRAFDAVIRGNPKVLILPRVILGWFLRPEDEPERFEAERQLSRHPATCKLSRTSTFSFSSDVWKSRGAEALREFLRFCEQEYGVHILGYHLAAGASGEWAYSWEPALSDASEPQRKAFADWLQRRYPDQRIDPATVTIPLDRTRRGHSRSCSSRCGISARSTI